MSAEKRRVSTPIWNPSDAPKTNPTSMINRKIGEARAGWGPGGA
jgi:hypothetical protein